MADDDCPQPALHAALSHLAPLVGAWSGVGHGEYPTIEPFDYREHVRLDPAGSKPFLVYEQRTWHASDGRPLHVELGYLRPAGPDRVELVLVQPTGIAEIDEGILTRTDDGLELVLTSRLVGRTSTAKEVTAVRRLLRLTGRRLDTRLDMAAVGRPMGRHLTSELHRIDPEADGGGTH